MHLTCIGAAKRPHTEVRAGAYRGRCRDARDGMLALRGATATTSITPAPPSWRGARRGEDTLSLFACFRLALLIL